MSKKYHSFKELAEALKENKPKKVESEIKKEDGHTELESVKNRLSSIKRNADALMSIISDQDYPEWWLAKLVKADDYLDTAKDFLQNKKDQGEA